MFEKNFKEMGECGEKSLTPLVAWGSIVNEGQVDLKKSLYHIHYCHHNYCFSTSYPDPPASEL